MTFEKNSIYFYTLYLVLGHILKQNLTFFVPHRATHSPPCTHPNGLVQRGSALSLPCHQPGGYGRDHQEASTIAHGRGENWIRFVGIKFRINVCKRQRNSNERFIIFEVIHYFLLNPHLELWNHEIFVHIFAIEYFIFYYIYLFFFV